MELRTGYKQTEVGVIPEDWEIQSLGNLTDSQRPISYGIVQTGPIISSGVRCLRVVDIEDGQINKDDLITTAHTISNAYKRTILRTGDLVTPLRGKVGDVALVDEDLAGSNLTRGVALIAIRSDKSAPFFKQLISSIATRNRLERSMNGSALQEVPIATFRAFKVTFPPTLAEQAAIANVLSDADALIQSLTSLIAKKRQIKQGTMQTLLNPYENGCLKEGWVVKRLGELCQPAGSRINPRVEKTNYKCIELEHISQETGRLLDCVNSKDQLSQKTVFKKGDVLFGKLRPYLKKYLYAEFNGVCSTELWVLKSGSSINSRWLYYLVQSDRVVEAANQSTGTKMPRAEWNVVKNTEVTMPTSIEEQIRIATTLSDMDAEINALETKLTKCQLIKQGMMQNLLMGRIRLI